MPFQTLIDPETLLEKRQNTWVVVDCRFSLNDTERGRRAYLESHIPGAYYAHLDEDLSGPIIAGETGRHPWPTIEKASELLGSWGISPTTQVVVYDDFGGAIAARLWWTLRWLGHDQVAVLNGGFPAWQKAGFPLASGEETSPQSVAFQARIRPHFITDAEGVERFRHDPSYVVIDARGAKRYRGEEEPIDPVAGHIPGAQNRPFPENLDGDGDFIQDDLLRARFEPFVAERSPDKVVVYCGSGVTACHNLLAMAHAGLGDGCLFTESWSGWLASGTRPVAVGEA